MAILLVNITTIILNKVTILSIPNYKPWPLQADLVPGHMSPS